MIYEVELEDEISKEFRRIYKKNRGLFQSIEKKIERLRENPYNSEPLSGNWKGHRSEHLPDSKIIIYKIDEDRKRIMIVKYGDHDKVYYNK